MQIVKIEPVIEMNCELPTYGSRRDVSFVTLVKKETDFLLRFPASAFLLPASWL